MNIVLASSPLVGANALAGLAEALRRFEIDTRLPDVPYDLDGFWVSVASEVDPNSVVVGFSAAGPRLFELAHRARPMALVFLDARLPADGVAPDDEPRFREVLDTLPCDDDGRLPPWLRWWPPEAMAHLIPNPSLRLDVARGCPSVPRSLFSEAIPAPPYDGPCGFVGFGDGYFDDAAESRARGWPTVVLSDAHHLWPIVEPDEVAGLIADMARRLTS